MARWHARVNEVKGTTLPLAHAIKKYGAECWEHEILLETDCLEEATQAEIKYIAELGYYNVAKGGQGGNTGRNGELWKRKQQAASISKHWKELPDVERKRRIRAGVASRRKNGTMTTPGKKGKEHGNWSGMWVVNNKQYTTLAECAIITAIDQSTILDLCVRKVDKVWTVTTKYVEKGQTPRQCGHYKCEK